jgi:hypothetical protein
MSCMNGLYVALSGAICYIRNLCFALLGAFYIYVALLVFKTNRVVCQELHPKGSGKSLGCVPVGELRDYHIFEHNMDGLENDNVVTLKSVALSQPHNIGDNMVGMQVPLHLLLPHVGHKHLSLLRNIL